MNENEVKDTENIQKHIFIHHNHFMFKDNSSSKFKPNMTALNSVVSLLKQ